MYHGSVDQCEYATDIVFKRQSDLAAIYGNLTRTAIHTVKPDSIAIYVEDHGKKVDAKGATAKVSLLNGVDKS